MSTVDARANWEKISRLKRLAIQIVAQLPEDPQEAQTVLRHAQVLVQNFLDDGDAREVLNWPQSPRLLR